MRFDVPEQPEIGKQNVKNDVRERDIISILQNIPIAENTIREEKCRPTYPTALRSMENWGSSTIVATLWEI